METLSTELQTRRQGEKARRGIVWVAPLTLCFGTASQARITTFPDDPENCLYSPDVVRSLA